MIIVYLSFCPIKLKYNMASLYLINYIKKGRHLWASKFVVQIVFRFFSRNKKKKVETKVILSKLERKSETRFGRRISMPISADLFI